MKRYLPVSVAAAMVAICMFIFGLQLDDFWLRLIAKPLPVLAMIAFLWRWGRGAYAKHIMVGLAFCMLGDILLEFRSKPMFIAGMIAFLLGHLGYVSGFVRRARGLYPVEALPFVLWIGWALTTMWAGLGGMRVPVTAYTLVIFCMMWRATAMVADEPERSPYDWCVVVGAITFAFSDTLIALDRFHMELEGVRVPIIVTYWLGQILITASGVSPNAEDEVTRARGEVAATA